MENVKYERIIPNLSLPLKNLQIKVTLKTSKFSSRYRLSIGNTHENNTFLDGIVDIN